MRFISVAPVLLAGVWADLAFLSMADQVFDMLFAAMFIGLLRAIYMHTKQTPAPTGVGPVACDT